MPKLRVAVDIGGTFTDICVLDENTGALEIAKVASSEDPIDAAFSGMDKLGIDLEDVTLFAHGTTVATNALITRQLPSTAMVVTAGFRDVIEIGRSTKQDLWDAYKDNPPPYIRRRDRLPFTERTTALGEVEISVDEAAARELAGKLRRRSYEAVTICFMNSFANPANEREMKRILAAELPGVAVSNSADVLCEIFEHDRFSTAVVNAVVHPVIGAYALRLQQKLRDGGYRSDLLLLHSGGGVMTPNTLDRQAARLAGSGIAAGAVASKYIASLCGFENSIGFDMGGTSTDVSLVFGGDLTVTREWYIEYGHPICFPSIDIKTIGAGGGSIAWIDDAGSLRNGPQSAGARPGPACYGQGGEQPTNTDADLLLGRLGSRLAGGDLRLDPALARAALARHVALPLGVGDTEAAKAVIDVANANMADAIRLVSIMRGYDPRDFALIAFGGAGALHGAALARDLSIPTVIVPPNPGVTSALGCLLVDIQHDITLMYLEESTCANPAAVEEAFGALETEAHERLESEGVEPAQRVLQRSIDMRYAGQWRSISVPVPAPFVSIDEVVRAFEEAHLREYKYKRDGVALEIFRLNLTAIGLTPKAELKRYEPSGRTSSPHAERPVVFDNANETLETPVYLRDDLMAGMEIEGPCIVEQLDSTTLVPPDATVNVDEWLNLRITV
ncbi:MAG: hydantoinase/oxoprolinase family protein [Gammaproteobacteria bacterium]|nr:hydantoinase/oxoprolinase family protein [Gammaproteobacteria bacterium]